MRRGAERSDGRCPARGDVRGAGGAGRAGTGAARKGQLLQAGERLPAAGRGICSGPGAGQPSHPLRTPSGRGDRSGLPRTFRRPGKLGEGADGAERGRRKAAGARRICHQHLCALERRVAGAGGHRAEESARGKDGRGRRGEQGAIGSERCAVPAPRQLPAGAISLHQRCPACPSRVVSFRKGFCSISTPRCRGKGLAEEGDINWRSLKICRAWDDLDYRRVESSNFPSITT